MRSVVERLVAPFAVDRRVLALAGARMADGIGNSFLIIVIPLYVTSGVVGGTAFGLGESLLIGVILSLFGFLNSSSRLPAGCRIGSAGASRSFWSGSRASR